mgnify:FL=1
MLAKRIIARLDIKPPQGVIKGLKFEGLRLMGDPYELATRYAEDGADELLYLDVAASLHGRPISLDLITRTTRDVDIPLTVGGGIRTLEDIRAVLRAGADKVAINSAALENPTFITDAARAFGSQAIVVSIEAKECTRDHRRWVCMKWQGREQTDKDVLSWAAEAYDLGAGELLVTAVDHDGMRDGGDVELPYRLSSMNIPVVMSGGLGSAAEIRHALIYADAVAIGSVLHYGVATIPSIKRYLHDQGVPVRL